MFFKTFFSVSLGIISSNWSEAIPRLGVCHNPPPLCGPRAVHPSCVCLQTDPTQTQEFLSSHRAEPLLQRRLRGGDAGTEETASLAKVSSNMATAFLNRTPAPHGLHHFFGSFLSNYRRADIQSVTFNFPIIFLIFTFRRIYEVLTWHNDNSHLLTQKQNWILFNSQILHFVHCLSHVQDVKKCNTSSWNTQFSDSTFIKTYATNRCCMRSRDL